MKRLQAIVDEQLGPDPCRLSDEALGIRACRCGQAAREAGLEVSADVIHAAIEARLNGRYGGLLRSLVEDAFRGRSHVDWMRESDEGPTSSPDIAGHEGRDPESGPQPRGGFEPFPLDALPPVALEFTAATSEAIGCDPSMVALPLLTMLGSAIGNSRALELKAGWIELPILWAVVVSPSGTLKSPAFDAALEPVRLAQGQAIKDWRRRMDAFKAAQAEHQSAARRGEGTGPPPIEPLCERMVVKDVTVEALGVRLEENPRGLLLARDELSGWLGSLDRYHQGKADAAYFLEMHRGGDLLVDRKTSAQKLIHVPRASVAICGGIQPATLRRALTPEYFENGLAARLLIAFPPLRPRKWTEASVDQQLRFALEAVYRGLRSLPMGLDPDGNAAPEHVGLDPEAKAIFISFYNAHAEEQLELDGHLFAAWSKLEAYVPAWR